MSEMIACCGVGCSQCPTFTATRNNDNQARQAVAKQWSQLFGMALSADDMNCDGCKTAAGRLFGHCQTCPIRSCCMEKDLDNCAGCDDYVCQNLAAYLGFLPGARESLEKIRKTLGKS